jgi:hypothetical protein
MKRKKSDYTRQPLPIPSECWHNTGGMFCLEYPSPMMTAVAYRILVANGVTPMSITLGDDSEEITLVIPVNQLIKFSVAFGGHDASHTPAPVLTAV